MNFTQQLEHMRSVFPEGTSHIPITKEMVAYLQFHGYADMLLSSTEDFINMSGTASMIGRYQTQQGHVVWAARLPEIKCILTDVGKKVFNKKQRGRGIVYYLEYETNV